MIFQNNEGETGKYIIQQLQEPDSISPEFRAIYKQFASRILWIDDNLVPGAFQMNTAWYKKAQPRDPLFAEHTHDYDELIGFFGSDPEDPYKLGAVIEFDLDGQTHRLDRTSLIFVPGGMKHNPLRLLEVEVPIFHFSVVMSPEYSGQTAYNTD
ncbi:MAG: hypothetical protein LBD12_04020 [Clostridiales Family XIII bacterium]|jgi:hypothetical protein|nr:hypothetical protein [Clostridiales Family XIII bacterium]